MKLEILDDNQAVARRAADLLCNLCNAAADKAQRTPQGRVDKDFISVALSGGTTPKLLYQLLAREPYRGRLPWGKIRWFVGDERNVPDDHPDNNFRMARETLFVPMGIPDARQFPVERVGVAPPEQVANDYEQTILQMLERKNDAGLPIFDVMLLGVGTDGHTASLFPHTEALKPPPGKVVVANFVDKFQAWRITMTKDVIQAADSLIVMVSGEDKAEAIKHVIEGELDIRLYPAQIARAHEGATWLLDKTAACQLENRRKQTP